MPLVPRVARAVDSAIGERLDGPIFLDADGRRLDRHAKGPHHPPGRNLRASRPTPSSPPLDAGVALRDVREAASQASHW